MAFVGNLKGEGGGGGGGGGGGAFENLEQVCFALRGLLAPDCVCYRGQWPFLVLFCMTSISSAHRIKECPQERNNRVHRENTKGKRKDKHGHSTHSAMHHNTPHHTHVRNTHTHLCLRLVCGLLPATVEPVHRLLEILSPKALRCVHARDPETLHVTHVAVFVVKEHHVLVCNASATVDALKVRRLRARVHLMVLCNLPHQRGTTSVCLRGSVRVCLRVCVCRASPSPSCFLPPSFSPSLPPSLLPSLPPSGKRKEEKT